MYKYRDPEKSLSCKEAFKKYVLDNHINLCQVIPPLPSFSEFTGLN